MKSLKEKFEERVFYASPCGCHYWTGWVSTHGYGSLQDNNTHVYAHRLSYQLYVGEIPKGLFVCHSCDNRLCVNPNHLWLGTHEDNQRDKISKGRNKIPIEIMWDRRFSDVEATVIKEAHDNGFTSKSIREYFKAPKSTVSNIIFGRTYLHLENSLK